ncbi:hypothetical protein MMC11_005633 [Xylographa trunciseda]|nr:hypothetical protein [Xylographa trunciseda]
MLTARANLGLMQASPSFYTQSGFTALTPPMGLSKKYISPNLPATVIVPQFSLTLRCDTKLLIRHRVASLEKRIKMGLCYSAPSKPPPPFHTYPGYPNAIYSNSPNVPYPGYPNASNPGYYNASNPGYYNASYPTYSNPPDSTYPKVPYPSHPSNPYPSGVSVPTFGPTNNEERRRLAKQNAKVAQERRREGKNEPLKSSTAPDLTRLESSQERATKRHLTMQRECQASGAADPFDD